MSRPEFAPETAARTLDFLAQQCVEPHVIDEAMQAGALDPSELLLTSMGTRNRAVITPYYPAIQFEPSLAQRIAWSRVYRRPFVEAAIGVSRKHRIASLTIRLCADSQAEAVNETSWQYPLDETVKTKTTWDVVGAIMDSALDGAAVPKRSGLVVVTKKRFSAGNWAVSHTFDPSEVVSGISTQVRSLKFTHPS